MISTLELQSSEDGISRPHDQLAGLWQPPTPRRRRRARSGRLMAVHDSTLMAGFDLTPVLRIATDRYGRHYPVGLRRGRLTRLDRHSSRYGFYCGMIHEGDDPRASAERGDLTLHHLAECYLDGHGFGEDLLEDALAELDIFPATGGWRR